MIEFELPFPSRALSPNASKRAWYNKEDARKFARTYAAFHVWNSGAMQEIDPNADYHATFTFFPPNKRKRDLDNVLAAMKPTIDGVCAGLAIDDSHFRRITIQWGEVVKGGKVVMRIETI